MAPVESGGEGHGRDVASVPFEQGEQVLPLEVAHPGLLELLEGAVDGQLWESLRRGDRAHWRHGERVDRPERFKSFDEVAKLADVSRPGAEEQLSEQLSVSHWSSTWGGEDLDEQRDVFGRALIGGK